MLVAVACRNASGEADLPVFEIHVSEHDRDLGLHYDLAEALAEDCGYEGPFVCFDPAEQPAINRAIAVFDGKLGVVRNQP